MVSQTSVRAGQYIRTIDGYTAFMPAPLPPDPPVRMDDPEFQALLSEADIALGRLDSYAALLPNPDLFVAAYVRKEAVLSSQIEGTQASLIDLFEYEANVGRKALRNDVSEVVNHVRAMNYGLERVRELPVSLRLFRKIHAELLKDVRGSELQPGEFRHSQNWIGPLGSTLPQAEFVPPPPYEMDQSLGDFERFLHDNTPMPALVKVGLLHCQFETIHPFLDGNGRIGRLLITFYLCHQKVLTRPLLYLSHYFKKHRSEYYDWLMTTRNNGDWEGWLKFFVQGVWEVATEAVQTAERILAMYREHQKITSGMKGRSALQLLEFLYENPIISVPQVAERLDITWPTARSTVQEFEDYGLLERDANHKHPRLFIYTPYLKLLSEGTT